MFWFAALIYILAVPYVVELMEDPAPGLARSVTEARGIKCRMLSKDEAILTGRFEVAENEGSVGTEDRYVTCDRGVFNPGERADQDEAILSDLNSHAIKTATTAIEAFPDVKQWRVAVHYPVIAVSYKINRAVWVALKEKRVQVVAESRYSEVEPFPAEPLLAENLKCDKHFGLDSSQTLLNIQLVDPNETQLHAGVCHKGAWKWLF